MTDEANTPSLRDHLRRAAKVGWMVAIVAFATWYFANNWADLRSYVDRVGVTQLVLSLVALTLGRVLLAQVSRIAVAMFDIRLPLIVSYAINAVSQMGKYVPGSVWHFVGRVALYRRYGLSAKQGTAVLGVENAALLVSGICMGAVPAFDLLVRSLGFHQGLSVAALFLGTLGGVALWFGLVGTLPRLFAKRITTLSKLGRSRIAWSCLLFWLLFGVAFAALLPRDELTLGNLLVATGTFALGWVAGNLAPFAPAGIGVREGIIVAVLGPHVGLPVAIGAATSSRLIWTIGEVAVAPAASFYLSRAEDSLERQG